MPLGTVLGLGPRLQVCQKAVAIGAVASPDCFYGGERGGRETGLVSQATQAVIVEQRLKKVRSQGVAVRRTPRDRRGGNDKKEAT